MEQYNGGRDLNSLVEFVTMMKAKAAIGPTEHGSAGTDSENAGAVPVETDEEEKPSDDVVAEVEGGNAAQVR